MRLSSSIHSEPFVITYFFPILNLSFTKIRIKLYHVNVPALMMFLDVISRYNQTRNNGSYKIQSQRYVVNAFAQAVDLRALKTGTISLHSCPRLMTLPPAWFYFRSLDKTVLFSKSTAKLLWCRKKTYSNFDIMDICISL